ncbi:MAG: shikimate dehydrogenase [Hyphomicrobiaceae bacterium]
MSISPRAFVIGWPIHHSRSPLIHGHWLNTYGLAGSYEKVAVRPEELGAFLGGLAERGFVGGNVTVPHKEQALALAGEATETARSIGAANTLWLERGRLQADNTDAYGFMTHLGVAAPEWQRRDGTTVLLGAGGAARAIAHGFLAAGVERIVLVNRSRDRAEALAGHFGRRVVVRDWVERQNVLDEASVLVNTTSLGMLGQPPLEIDLARLRPPATVADIVYAPLETPLLATARTLGHATVDGLGMLLNQAVPGFERWFGVRPVVTAELRALIARDIEAA